MDFLMMGGIVCMSLALVLFFLIKVGAKEAVYYRSNSVKVMARVVEAREVPFTVSGSSKEQYRYEMTVAFDIGGSRQLAEGLIEKSQYTDHAYTPGKEVCCYYDINAPENVIFYDPAAYAAKGDRNYKISFALLLAGVALLLIGKFL